MCISPLYIRLPWTYPTSANSILRSSTLLIFSRCQWWCRIFPVFIICFFCLFCLIRVFCFVFALVCCISCFLFLLCCIVYILFSFSCLLFCVYLSSFSVCYCVYRVFFFLLVNRLLSAINVLSPLSNNIFWGRLGNHYWHVTISPKRPCVRIDHTGSDIWLLPYSTQRILSHLHKWKGAGMRSRLTVVNALRILWVLVVFWCEWQ